MKPRHLQYFLGKLDLKENVSKSLLEVARNIIGGFPRKFIDLKNVFPCYECNGDGYKKKYYYHNEYEDVPCPICRTSGMVDKYEFKEWHEKEYGSVLNNNREKRKKYNEKKEKIKKILSKLKDEEIDYLISLKK